jgi:hypothetical protein
MAIDTTTLQRANAIYSDAQSRVGTSAAGVSATSSAQGPSDTPAAPIVGATVTLSPDAQRFAAALAQAQVTPDVRPDRLAAVRAKLAAQNGDGIDTDALAAKLLGSQG